jgi:phage gpG-like protein
VILNVQIFGDREVILRMENMPGAVRDALIAKVQELTNRLQQYIINEKLHGQVLGQRSGRLVQSLQTRFEDTGDKIKGHVYSAGTVKYAAFWEFGFTGTEDVREYVRTANHLFGKATDAYSQTVRAHTRHVNQPARSYMRTGLADLASGFEHELIEAAVGAMKKAA